MNFSLTTMALAIAAVFSFSTNVQAVDFGPKVKWCSISVEGIHESMLFGYSFATGDLDCSYSNRSKTSEPVAMRVYSLGAQIGNCDMDLYAKIAGADIGLNLFKGDILQAFAGVEILNPVRTLMKNKQKTLSANAIIDIDNVGAGVMVAEATYGKGCLIGAKVNLGKIQTGAAYKKAVAKHKRMLERRKQENDR